MDKKNVARSLDELEKLATHTWDSRHKSKIAGAAEALAATMMFHIENIRKEVGINPSKDSISPKVS